jgi:hypothetical protein
MQIHQLPRGGQFSIKGNVVNVLVDIQPTINSLPRNIDKSGTIAVKLKKKLQYKKSDFSENVRPLAVICGLHYLMKKSEMYKMSGIQINSEWINEINGIQSNDASEDESHEEQQELNNQNDDSDHFSEVDETDLHVGNTDTQMKLQMILTSLAIKSMFLHQEKDNIHLVYTVILMLNIWLSYNILWIEAT